MSTEKWKIGSVPKTPRRDNGAARVRGILRLRVRFASRSGHFAQDDSAVYTGTKGAVDAITGVLAKELGPKKIRVNSINPGMVETEGAHAAGFIGSDFEAGTVAQTPLGRIGQVDDIASVATFLASNDSQWITGELVRAGGGLR